MSLIEIGMLGFVIGLTGALAPGPTLIATITTTIRNGWMSGPRVTGGHIMAEIFVVILIALGIPFLPAGGAALISGIGGIALIIFGVLTIQAAKTATIAAESDSYQGSSPVIAGLVTSLSNPYFWIWWFSVGSALLVTSYTSGVAGLLVFIAGHWIADLSWFTLVSVSVHKSRVLLGDREYRMILVGCGTILLIFGLWFILSGLHVFPTSG
ncbi:MAG TPA: LysE family transporter [Methanospirillum sp.]|nr:LysE family transporter [Methanospirillum sp.]